MYFYHHEEDESSFQLVDTARVQRPQHQRSRGRYNQVRLHHCSCFTFHGFNFTLYLQAHASNMDFK